MSRAATRPIRSSSRVSWPALVIDACAHLQASAPAEALEARVREANPSLEWNSGSFKEALRSTSASGGRIESTKNERGELMYKLRGTPDPVDSQTEEDEDDDDDFVKERGTDAEAAKPKASKSKASKASKAKPKAKQIKPKAKPSKQKTKKTRAAVSFADEAGDAEEPAWVEAADDKMDEADSDDMRRLEERMQVEAEEEAERKAEEAMCIAELRAEEQRALRLNQSDEREMRALIESVAGFAGAAMAGSHATLAAKAREVDAFVPSALGAALRATGALSDAQVDDFAEKFEIAYSNVIPDEEQPVAFQTGFALKKQQVSFKSVAALSRAYPTLKTTKELSWLTLAGASCAGLPALKTAIHADVLRHLKAAEPPMALLCFRGAGEKPSGALLAVLDAARVVQGYVACKQCPHAVWSKMFA